MVLRRPNRRFCTVFCIPSVLRNLHVFVILVCCTFLPYVTGVGVFEVKLQQIGNPEGRDMDHNCCSGLESNGVCSSPCRAVFVTCLRQYRPAHPADCTYGYNVSAAFDGNSFALTSKNVVRFPIQTNWPGSFSLKVKAQTAGSSKPIITALIAKPSYGASLQWFNYTQSVATVNGAKISLSLSYRLICAPHNYGGNCSKTCTPRNDQHGRFTCDANGNRVCIDGWGDSASDIYCVNPICEQSCGPNGKCRGPNFCRCSKGWAGSSCSECEVHPGCVHGTCQDKWQCNCNSGWGGLYCDLELDYCGRYNPCQRGSCRNTAPGRYRCICDRGYGGLNCQSEINECASKPCQNGGNCTDKFLNFTCACLAGYRGKQCEVNIDDCVENACSNGGTCVDGARSFSCLCPAGFSGKTCATLMPRPTTRGPELNMTVKPTDRNNGNDTVIGGQNRAGSSSDWKDVEIVIIPIVVGVLLVICLIVGCILCRTYRKRCCSCCRSAAPPRDIEEPNTRIHAKQLDPTDDKRHNETTDLKRSHGGTSKQKTTTPDIIINFVPARSGQKNVNTEQASQSCNENEPDKAAREKPRVLLELTDIVPEQNLGELFLTNRCFDKGYWQEVELEI